MKQIFRGVLILKYTDNQEQITLDQLKDFLRQNNQYNEESFKQTVENFELLIDELIDVSQKDQIEDILAQFGLSNEQSAELMNVWNTEKDRVFSQLIKQNTRGAKLEKLQWSINNQFYGKRNKNINQVTCIVNLKAKNLNDKNYQYHTFELKKNDIQYLEEQFKKIEQTISALML